MLLRIDDMDQERVRPEYIEDIFRTLSFMGIPWQEGPRDAEEFLTQYSQHHRLELYQKTLQVLREMNLVYACSCSRKEIENTGGYYPGTCRHKNIPLHSNNVCWRLNTSQKLDLNLKVYGGESMKSHLPESMKDFVIRRKNGLPAYQLCSVVDDVHFGVDLIVRGEDLLPSTLAQLYLAKVLELENFLSCTFLHHSLFLGADGIKLSKSAGSTSIQFYREQQKTVLEMYKLIGRYLGLNEELKNWEEIHTK